MTTYEDICSAWRNKKQAQRKLHDDLAGFVEVFKQDVLKNLGLADKVWASADGERPYAEIGQLVNEDFEKQLPCLIEVYFRDGLMILPFALALTIEEGPNVFPKEKVMTDFEVSIGHGIVRMKLLDGKNNKEYTCGAVHGHEFGPVIEEYKSIILSQFKV